MSKSLFVAQRSFPTLAFQDLQKSTTSAKLPKLRNIVAEKFFMSNFYHKTVKIVEFQIV